MGQVPLNKYWYFKFQVHNQNYERVKRDIATLQEKINELELKLVARDEQPKERKTAANSNEKCEKLELTLNKNKALMEHKLEYA